MHDTDERLAGLVSKVASKPSCGEVLWRVRSDDHEVDFTYGDPTRPFFIASATKLYVTAILAQLRTEGRLDWDQPIAGYLPDLDLTGLFVVGGRDRIDEVTVRSVMAHTSGLADYFEGERPNGTSTFGGLLRDDSGWDVRDVIAWTKTMTPATPGKGHYSDTGYQLLGAVIERADGRTFAESVRTRIAEPLGLPGTYCFSTDTIDRFDEISPLLYGDTRLRIPLAMASVKADGGIVSTLDDASAFLDAFFSGRLFPAPLLDEMQTDWHRIFFPLEYGTGIMRFRLPRYLTGLRKMSPFVGHSGASGTVMFRCPDRRVTVVGTVNQTKQRSLPFQLMVRTAG